MAEDISLYTLPNDQPINLLDCTEAFNGLSEKEKLYAHYLSKASWDGGLIVFIQTSPESPLIFAVLHNIFLAESISELKTACLSNNISEDEFTAFLIYACGIYSNSGNYKDFGDTKIIPNLPKDKFKLIIKKSVAYVKNSGNIQNIFNKCFDDIYNLEEKVKSLGLAEKGITTYFSSNCTDEDAKLVTKYMQNKHIDLYNTRCFKTLAKEDDQIKCVYEIRFPSIETSYDPKITLPEEVYENSKFKFTRGDYDLLLLGVVENLKKAKDNALNEAEINMLSRYIEHFESGSLEEHKNGSRFWIKDKGPVVETYIGFIENYRDPAGQRAEFEGFVAMVNSEMSKKFECLVKNAEKYISMLPWGKDFEKDHFSKPDFTSLDVLTFAGSGIPTGINIPNYDEIRQNEGFKNVTLGNVIRTSFKFDTIPFLSEEDQVLMRKHAVVSYEVKVALHELLGHGSGKLLRKTDGKYNFDYENLKNPLTNEPVTYYENGQTYDSVFGSMGSAYEECKAEAVGLYLSLEKEIVKMFGVPDSEIEDVIYVNWLMVLWTGCGKTLEMYNPSNKKWRQAHSQGRYVLMRVCLEAGDDFLKIVETDDGKNFLMTLDKSKINTTGKKAIGEFLKKMQIYKSTADIKNAQDMFMKYSEVPETGSHPWAKWRDIVLANKKPRKILGQANTFIDDNGKVNLKTYEPTFEGFIQSWVERFPSTGPIEKLLKLWERDVKHFSK